jgi:hypothetical protein
MGFIRGYDWEGEEKPEAMVFLAAKLRIRLTDPQKNPVARGKCRVAEDPTTMYDCDADGVAEIPLQDRTQKTLELEWEGPEAGSGNATERFPWSNSFEVDIQSAQDGDCGKRLTHLGFYGDTLTGQVLDYQDHFGLQASGKIGDIRTGLVAWHDGGGPPGGGVATEAAPPEEESAGKKATRKLWITQHDDHDFDEIHAALKRHPDYQIVNKPDASKTDILDAMEMARDGDIFLFEGHTYSKFGGPVLGIKGDNWFGEDHITLAEIQSSLTGTSPSVAIFVGCNSSEILPSARAAGVKLAFGIENVVRDTISHDINEAIADKLTVYLLSGYTIRDATDKVNTWLEHNPQNNGNRVSNESATEVNLDLNLEDNGL